MARITFSIICIADCCSAAKWFSDSKDGGGGDVKGSSSSEDGSPKYNAVFLGERFGMEMLGSMGVNWSGSGRNGSCSALTEGERVFTTLLLPSRVNAAIQSSCMGDVSPALEINPAGSSSSVTSVDLFSFPTELLRRDRAPGMISCMLYGSRTHVSPESAHAAQG